MRFVLGVVMVSAVACGGTADDLRSKEWKKLDARPGSIGSPSVFDPSGRLLEWTIDEHVYRFDDKARVWSDLGAVGSLKLYNDASGDIYAVDARQNGTTVSHLLDTVPLTFEPFIEAPYGANVVLDRNGVGWRYLPASGELYRYEGSTWTLVRSDLPGPGQVISTMQGNLVHLQHPAEPGQTVVTELDDMGANKRVLYDCHGSVLTHLCTATSSDYWFNSDGSVSWINNNDIDGSRMFYLAAGETAPVERAVLPTERDYETYNHTLTFGYDGDGNAYATRSDNNYGTESLFYLEANGDEWQYINDTPGFVDLAIVRRDGTVFLFNGGGGRDFYVLE